MTKVYVGYTNGGEQGYDMYTSSPQVVFDNLNAVKRWKKLHIDREYVELEIQKHAVCHTCKSEIV